MSAIKGTETWAQSWMQNYSSNNSSYVKNNTMHQNTQPQHSHYALSFIKAKM